MAQIQLLDHGLLNAFECALAGQPGRLLSRLEPGLTPVEVEDALEDAGVPAADEAVLWWSWRNGSGRVQLLPGFQMISLAGALKTRRTLQAIAERQATASGIDPGTWWKPSWLPIFDTGGQDDVVIECSRARNAPSSLRQVDVRAIDEPHFASVVASSLGEFVSRATAALGAGRYHYEPGRNTWLPTDWTRLPPGAWS